MKDSSIEIQLINLMRAIDFSHWVDQNQKEMLQVEVCKLKDHIAAEIQKHV